MKVGIKKLMIFILFACSLSVIFHPVDLKAEKMEVQLGWVYSPDYALFYLGIEKGFYRDVALDLELVPGEGSSLTAKLLGSGEKDIGLMGVSNVLSARSKGLPLKVVANIFQKTPDAVVFDGTLGIKDLKDLEGRRVAARTVNTPFLNFRLMLKENDVDIDKINIISLSRGSTLKLFVAGEADAFIYFGYDAVATLETEYPDRKFGYFNFSDYGINTLSMAVVANEGYVNNNPGQLKRFVDATVKSIDYAVQHPEEAIDATMRKIPGSNRASVSRQVYEIVKLLEDEYSQKYGIACIPAEKMKETADLLISAGEIPNEFNWKEAYTEEFLK